tara:strand:+ start:175 stop:2052 length:1878 start_codon:yes stop_codon:yes gene_type:complete
VTNIDFIEKVFNNKSNKHGFNVFDKKHVNKLKFKEAKKSIQLICLIRKKYITAKPEEIVRQLELLNLTSDYGYEENQILVEVPIVMGSGYAPKKADIVIYNNQDKTDMRGIIEVKKPKRKDGLLQLQSYMNATGVYFGKWTNGLDEVSRNRQDPNVFETINRFPKINETIDEIKKPLIKSELEPIVDLKSMIEELEETTIKGSGVSAFDALFPLIFSKLYDEYITSDDGVCEFRTTSAPPKDQMKKIIKLFSEAKKEWSGIFKENEDIDLTPTALITIVSSMQKYKFFDTNLDILDAAFEYLINPEQKKDKGQYFTPRHVIKMCVKMLDPNDKDKVLDPACGAGGFLIHTLNHVDEKIISKKYKSDSKSRKLSYASNKLFGLDYDRRLVKVTKAMMLIAGDGKTNTFKVNTLDHREWSNREDNLEEKIKENTFDIVLTNPPFAGTHDEPEILGRYDLAYKDDEAKNKRAKKMRKDMLFIEKCIRLIKPGGRIAIVLPQGNLNNPTSEFLRNFIFENCRLLGCVGLKENTFRPFTPTKTSVVLLQKWKSEKEKTNDYNIFMADSEKPGKDNSGNYIYLKDKEGNYINEKNQIIDVLKIPRIVDHDLDQIIDEFEKFKKKENLNFNE